MSRSRTSPGSSVVSGAGGCWWQTPLCLTERWFFRLKLFPPSPLSFDPLLLSAATPSEPVFSGAGQVCVQRADRTSSLQFRSWGPVNHSAENLRLSPSGGLGGGGAAPALLTSVSIKLIGILSINQKYSSHLARAQCHLWAHLM